MFSGEVFGVVEDFGLKFGGEFVEGGDELGRDHGVAPSVMWMGGCFYDGGSLGDSW